MRLVALAAFAVGAFAFSSSAVWALDCSKAKSKLEKAICADPAANAADDAMSAAFSRLRASLSPDASAALLENQRDWNRKREGRCSDKEGAQLTACYRKDAESRIAFLEGRPEAGTYPAGTFEPFLTIRKAKRNGDYDIGINLMRFKNPATAAEKAFNAQVAAATKDAPLNEPRDASVGRKLEYSMDMTLTYASPAFISAMVMTYWDGGGAHPNHGNSFINIDGRSGRKLELSAVFLPGMLDIARSNCLAQIKKQKKAVFEDFDEKSEMERQYLGESFPKVFAEVANWSFSPEGAMVNFNPYEIGAYAEGYYNCKFDRALLKSWAKPDFPLP